MPTPATRQSLTEFFDLPSYNASIADQMPTSWFVVFHLSTKRRWLHWLAFGRFKHVSCFAWVDSAQRWVFFDPALERSWLRLVPDDMAGMEPAHEQDIKANYYGGDIGHYSKIGVVVKIDTQIVDIIKPNIGFARGCVREVARLIGIRTRAMRPDALFRDCLRLGGVVINPERLPPPRRTRNHA
ncbi:hypothetical protein [Agrobacterium tumefaciens]|jgi:hypothetical protein|uniref:hypothetical protein n=1 Tax=Agrobacterium tumefaciens TaxID=358 RepID=UPI000DD099D3|nr:hypothetical protein FY143_07875 [Agrobacterium tumefaciens]UXT81345.1 hypothetical protein FY131_07730 [Agrobacterium tumefaciens]